MSKETATPSVKYTFVLYGHNKLADAIQSAEKDGLRLKYKLHNIALSIITHWGKGVINKDQAAEYFTTLGKAAGYHGKALANWVGMKTPLKYSEEKKVWYAPPEAKVNGDTFKAARDEPFWEVSPPAEPKPFDALALLEALLQKNNTKATDPAKVKDGDKLLPPGAITLLREAIQKAKAVNEENIPH